MEQDNYKRVACPTRYTIQILKGKWKLNVIWQLIQHENIRFNELQRQLDGISAVVLKRALQELQDDKIINRIQYNEMPLRVEYSLTQSGKDLIPIFKEMGNWGRKTYKEQFEK